MTEQTPPAAGSANPLAGVVNPYPWELPRFCQVMAALTKGECMARLRAVGCRVDDRQCMQSMVADLVWLEQEASR